VTDTAFMTHADVPFLATKDLIENPLNPFTQRPVRSEKQDGALIAASSDTMTGSKDKYKFNIKKYSMGPMTLLHTTCLALTTLIQYY
jgi:hypothetical protein